MRWSVIVPIKGARPFLAQAMGSILDQLPPDSEILLADNGPEPLSQDPPPEPIAYHWNGRDLGLYGSVNAAIRRSSGTLIHVLHDDDFLSKGFYKAMEAVRWDCPLQVGMYWIVDESDHTAGPVTYFEHCPAGILGGVPEQLTRENPFQACATVFTRGLWDTVGPFREDMPYAGDWEWLARAAAVCDFQFVPEALAYYRLHPGQGQHRLIEDGTAERDVATAQGRARELLQGRAAAKRG